MRFQYGGGPGVSVIGGRNHWTTSILGAQQAQYSSHRYPSCTLKHIHIACTTALLVECTSLTTVSHFLFQIFSVNKIA